MQIKDLKRYCEQQQLNLHMCSKQLHAINRFVFFSDWMIFSAFLNVCWFEREEKKSLSKLKSKSLFLKLAVLVQKSFTPWGVNSTLAETPPLPKTHTMDWRLGVEAAAV